MPTGSPQGWCQDPFGLHEARYFSAGRPTKLVRDGNVESYDEPPPRPYQRPGAATAERPLGPGPTASPRAYPGQAPWSASATGNPPGYHPAADLPGYHPAADLPGYHPAADPPGYHPAAHPPRRVPGSVFVAAAALAIATIAGIVLKSSGSGSSQGQPAASPAAFVTTSAQHTLAQSTADMTLSGTIQVAGQNVALSGTGETDFSTGATELSASYGLSGKSLAEEAVVVGGNMYLTLTIDGKSLSQLIGGLTGGRDWVEVPVGQSGSADLSGSDALASLSELEQQGNTVQALGTKTIDGVTCTGYTVTPSRQAMLAAIKEEAAKLGFSSAITSQFSSVAASMSPPEYIVWFDAQGLLREMGMNWQMTAVGANARSSSLVVNFSNYGSPVHISAPAPSDILSYSSLEQMLSGHTSL